MKLNNHQQGDKIFSVYPGVTIAGAKEDSLHLQWRMKVFPPELKEELSSVKGQEFQKNVPRDFTKDDTMCFDQVLIS